MHDRQRPAHARDADVRAALRHAAGRRRSRRPPSPARRTSRSRPAWPSRSSTPLARASPSPACSIAHRDRREPRRRHAVRAPRRRRRRPASSRSAASSINNPGVGYTLAATSTGITPATSSAFRVERSAFSRQGQRPGRDARVRADRRAGAARGDDQEHRRRPHARIRGPAAARRAHRRRDEPAERRDGRASTAAMLQLRSLGLAPGASLTIALTVSTPCATSRAVAHLADADRRGRPRTSAAPSYSTSTRAPSALGTEVTGVCTLRFLTAPADAGAGTPITGTPFNTSGLPVMVELLAADGARVGDVGHDGHDRARRGRRPRHARRHDVARRPRPASRRSPASSIDQRGTYTLVASSAATRCPSPPTRSRSRSVGVACAEDVTCSGTVPAVEQREGQRGRGRRPEHRHRHRRPDGRRRRRRGPRLRALHRGRRRRRT